MSSDLLAAQLAPQHYGIVNWTYWESDEIMEVMKESRRTIRDRATLAAARKGSRTDLRTLRRRIRPLAMQLATTISRRPSIQRALVNTAMRELSPSLKSFDVHAVYREPLFHEFAAHFANVAWSALENRPEME